MPADERGGGGADLTAQVRDALRHLNDYAYLQFHPLSRFLSREPGGDTGNTGKRLSQCLQEAITGLQPEGTADSTSVAQRRYRLLTLRYLNFLEAPAVQQRLAISRSTYHREHALALDAITASLRNRWRLGDDAASAAESARVPPLQGSRLPLPVTSFVGREREIAAVERLLDRARLVTLTGPPGTGKTRLALQVAERRRVANEGSVCFVPLAPVRDVSAVVPAIALALGVPERTGRPLLETLQDQLSDQRLLLVLDNLEQVLLAATAVGELLQAAPQLRVLATSRAPLHVYGEHDFLVPPLPLPDRVEAAVLAHSAQSEAVRLFVERAQAVESSFALSAANAGTVAEICRRLDGLPLAIELAAARLRFFPPLALLARLEHRLPLLTEGPRDLPARQQTLRAAIDWSYDLLAPAEQAVFRRLAVFVGGGTLEAAEAVCTQDEPGVDVLAAMAALVDQRLLRQEPQPDGEPRFSMLESIREYAWDRLHPEAERAPAGVEAPIARDEAERTRQRHAHYFLALAETGNTRYLAGETAEQRRQIARLETEHDNLRAALHWFEERRTTGESLRLAGALAWFWLGRSYWSEGRHWLDRALDLPGAVEHPDAWALALQGAGTFALAQGDLRLAQSRLERSVALWRAQGERRNLAATLAALANVGARNRDLAARAAMAESLALFQALGDQHGVAALQLQLGSIAAYEGDYAQAEALLTASRAFFVQAGDPTNVAAADWRLGYLAMVQGDYAQARTWLEQSLAGFHALGEQQSIARQGMGIVLARLGELADQEGDYAQAASFCHQALVLARDLGDKDITAWALKDLGRVTRHQGNEEQASALFRESLALRREQGHQWALPVGLWELAEGALYGRQHERAVRLFAAAEAQRAASSALPAAGDLSGYDPADADRHLAALRTALPAAAVDAAWLEGQAMTLDEAVAYALARDEQRPHATEAMTRLPGSVPGQPPALTRREQEVAVLIARGRTDRQVAVALGITEGTVGVHTERLYRKLGVHTRAEVATWVVARGLVATVSI